MRRTRLLLLLPLALGLVAIGAWLLRAAPALPSTFDSNRAYADVLAQTDLGPRPVGSPAHDKVIVYIRDQLEGAGWTVEVQRSQMMGQPIQNIVAHRGESAPVIILGAHYDSRLLADRDPDPAKRSQPVPGANDGASGVAILLELARSLPADIVPLELAFFDAEDNGNIPGWDWILGSQAFVAALETKPEAMVLVDMIGDTHLTLPQEGYSDPTLTRSIWDTAERLGYGKIFRNARGASILDDHIPFVQAGIPSVDIIDIDYPHWHTTADTADKVSVDSLQAVGATLFEWLINYSE
jgi:Zn-dependent M28 family amino/carboxypeptidase